jgi:F0F1-type ATP synthase assembly protein I
MPDDNPKPLSSNNKKNAALGNLVQAESMLQIALAVPAGTFAGLLIGYLLDRHFHTKWIVVLGMLLGATGGFIQIFTSMSRLGKRSGR